MACREQDSGALSAVELIADRGLEALAQALAVLIDEAMRLARERHRGGGRSAPDPGRWDNIKVQTPRRDFSRIHRSPAVKSCFKRLRGQGVDRRIHAGRLARGGGQGQRPGPFAFRQPLTARLDPVN